MATLDELKEAFVHVVFDEVGGFDKRKDRERYIRFLETYIQEQRTEMDKLRQKLEIAEEQAEIKYIMESR
jgi:hypothetical protein